LGGSHGVDVTGGMRAKVEESLAMVRTIRGLQIVICSGLQPGNLGAALDGRHVGTLIRAD
jgi:isopentenyl phosphate kinase